MKKMLYRIYSIMLLLCISTYGGVMLNGGKSYADYSGSLSAKSAMLLDYDSGTVVYEKNSEEKLPIASMVKLMTIYLTFQSIETGKLNLDEKVTASQNASDMGGSQVFIDAYSSYSVEDLLKSVIIASANDASVVLAEAISGSEENFVSLMNETAKQLGMNNTLYANSTGLPAPSQYSTAKDCAIILKNVISFEAYHKYSTIWMDTLVHPSGRKTELVNTNKLIKYYEGCDGGKTGSTNEAGYCLSTSAKRDNMRLISIVIGAKTGSDRFKDSTNLLNYGFANYQNKQIINKDLSLLELKTKRCKTKLAEIVATENFFAFDKRGSKSSYDLDYDLPEQIGATKVGQIVGKVVVSKNGNVVKTIPLTVKNDLQACTYKDDIKSILKNW